MLAIAPGLPAAQPAGDLDWEQQPGFKSALLPVLPAGKAGFTSLPGPVTGVLFTNFLSEEHSLTNHILLNGSGIAAGDVDGDGWCDLYFCSLDGPNKLYRNLGNWKFEDITASAGVACDGQYSTGAVFADVDGDGHLDLLVNSVGHGTRCFRNDGKGHFTEVTQEAGLASRSGSMSMALADIDGNGTLDLYVANYSTWTMRDGFSLRFKVSRARGHPEITMVNGRPVTEPDLAGRFSIDENGGIAEHGEADVLYRNDGKGHFTTVPFTGGCFLDEDGKPLSSPPQDWGLSVMFRDINGDGLPDIFVCNDLGSTNRVWINSGHGCFQAIRRLALRKTSWFSMGVDFADINRDGADDFFVADMLSRSHQMRQTQNNDHKSLLLPIGQIENRPQYARNTLFLNNADGDYTEIAYFSGVAASDWSWSPVFLDVDLDGYEDLLLTTGFERNVQDIDLGNELEKVRQENKLSDLEALKQRKLFPRLAPGNVAFRNRGDLTFEDAGEAWGFNLKGVSQGIALADLDHDGDLDVIINNLNGPATILRNDASAPRVAVRLRGKAPNTRGIGAKIQVTGGPVRQSQEMLCGGRYLSSDDTMRVFAAGSATNDLRIEVTWRNGTQSVVQGKANHIYEIDEGGAGQIHSPESKPQSPDIQSPKSHPQNPPSAIRHPPFQDMSHLIAHVHHEDEFNDFEQQPLLPKRLSQLGPGVAWADLDGDGFDDLLIGTGKDGQLAVYYGDGNGGFKKATESSFSGPVTRDQTTILTLPDGTGGISVVVGTSNFEDGLTNGASARIYSLVPKGSEANLPGQLSSTGPMASADIEGSGELTLFVGGRTIPGRYPEPASSKLYRHRAGQWRLDQSNSRTFEKVGLVSGAVFSDLDGDGLPELILACEWGPIRIFKNEHGQFTEATKAMGLDFYTGWWNGVTTGDVDGDGRLDIIASNWGRNSKYESHREQPLRLFYGDFNHEGNVELIEAYYDKAMGKVVPWPTLDRVVQSLPMLRQRFQTFREYGAASVAEILGDRMNAAKELQANWLDSTVFLNRGDHFEARPLPVEAQLSPAFALCVADFDGDGVEDIFLSQNFFATEPRTGRYDGGRGLWLRGDGKGGFTAVPAKQSGVMLYGESRGAAVSDYDGDGRVDLAVTQNGAATKLYHNLGAKPGLRVRLQGAAGNAKGIGAVLRLVSAGGMGPAREIHAGSGYWSQDSAVQVLSSPEPPTQIWVRWPGGKTNLFDLPSGAREITLNEAGKLKLLR